MFPALLGGLEVAEDVVEAVDDVEDAHWGRIDVDSG